MQLTTSKTAQVFTLDLILGLIIMTVAVLALTIYTTTAGAPLRADAERVSTLMTPGVPEDWNTTNVIIPGFLTAERFNESKIQWFANMTPAEQRRLLGISSNFHLRFRNTTNDLTICTTCGVAPVDVKEVLPIRRYGLFNGSIVIMEVLLYQ
jgi:hypothetical protein